MLLKNGSKVKLNEETCHTMGMLEYINAVFTVKNIDGSFFSLYQGKTCVMNICTLDMLVGENNLPEITYKQNLFNERFGKNNLIADVHYDKGGKVSFMYKAIEGNSIDSATLLDDIEGTEDFVYNDGDIEYYAILNCNGVEYFATVEDGYLYITKAS